MKVLKNNYNQTDAETNIKIIEPYPRAKICEKCRSELQYDESDLRMGFLGCVYIDCPLCHYDNMIEENENTITLTKDNVEFPTHFWHTSVKASGAKDCCNNEEVKKCIQRAIENFRQNGDSHDYYWFTLHGKLYISVTKYDGDESYEVMVSNDFYTTSIPFESKDY